jgi:hypothetical protein
MVCIYTSSKKISSKWQYRTSTTNCAQIYNNSFVNKFISTSCTPVWSNNLELDVEDVWNGFFLHSLLLDHIKPGTVFELDHNASSQSHCLCPALEAQSLCIMGPGQEEWNHAHNLCCWICKDENGILCMFHLIQGFSCF